MENSCRGSGRLWQICSHKVPCLPGIRPLVGGFAFAGMASCITLRLFRARWCGSRVNGGDTRHWVLIETSGNQAYIFGTNRLRHVVGASDLIRQVGTVWAPEAASAYGAVIVMLAGR